MPPRPHDSYCALRRRYGAGEQEVIVIGREVVMVTRNRSRAVQCSPVVRLQAQEKISAKVS